MQCKRHGRKNLLYVLLILLKIIGILLALVIGLVLLILIAPIRYSFQFQMDEETSPGGQIKVTWLLFIFYVKASYIDKIFDYRVRICGYQILGNQKEFLERRQRKNEKKHKKKEEKNTRTKQPQQKEYSLPKEKNVISEKKTVPPTIDQTKQKETDYAKPVSSEKKMDSHTKKKKKTGTKKRWITLIKEKIDEGKKTWKEYHGAQLLEFAKKTIIRVMKHILPRKLQGYLRFGFDDPAWTGFVTGIAAMFYPRYHRTFILEPDFGEQCFVARCKGKGRIHLGFFLYIGITALMNRDVRVFIKKIL